MSICVEKTFDELKQGDEASFKEMIDEKMIEAFADFSGDMNPLHTDSEFAARTPLKKRIAHGQIAGALFSRLIGMYLPGKYSLYLKQTLEFVKPIWPGTQVIVNGVITNKIVALNVVEVHMTLLDIMTGEELVRGIALVKLLA